MLFDSTLRKELARGFGATLVVILTIVITMMLIRVLGRMFRRYSSRIQESMGELTRITGETLQSHRVIKIFNGQEYERRRFESANERNRRMNMRLFATRAAGDAVTALLAAVGMAGIVFVASQDAVRSALDIGDFGAFKPTQGSSPSARSRSSRKR